MKVARPVYQVAAIIKIMKIDLLRYGRFVQDGKQRCRIELQ